MDDFGKGGAPWDKYYETVKQVEITSGVTYIGEMAFSNFTDLSITMADTVTSIGYGVFYCSHITSITLSANLKSIGSSVFESATLPNMNIELPSGLKEIGSSAFYQCTGLTGIVIPDSVTTVEKRAFESCNNLQSAVLSAGMTEVPPDMFSFCKSLTTVTIPNGITAIAADAFTQTGLTSVSIPSSVKTIGTNAFNDAPLTSVSFAEGLSEIGSGAFANTKIVSVALPASLLTLAASAFNSDSALKSISVHANNPNYISDENGVLYNKDKSLLIQYPVASQATNYTIPDSVTTISSYAFCGAKSLSSVSFGQNLTTIENNAFAGCTGLADTILTINDAVETIGEYAFYCCGLKGVILGKQIKKIGSLAFYQTSPRLAVYYKGTEAEWKAIGASNAFWGADFSYEYGTIYNVTGISFDEERTFMEVGAQSTLTAKLLPKKATNTNVIWESSDPSVATVIGSGSSVSDSDVCVNAAVTPLQTGTTVISATTEDGGYRAECTVYVINGIVQSGQIRRGYKDVIYAIDNDNVLHIAGKGEMYDSFYSGDDLPYADRRQAITKAIVYPGVTTLGNYIFNGCSMMTEVELPNTITSIGDHAFDGCSSLQSVHIPASVTVIGSDAFLGCNAVRAFSVDAENQSYCADEYGVLFDKEKIFLIKYPAASSTTYYKIPSSVLSLYRESFANAANLSSIFIHYNANMNSFSQNTFKNCSNIQDVYFSGTEYNWERLTRSHDALAKATKHYNAPVPIESITLNQNEIIMTPGQTETLTATVLPNDANTAVTWKSNDTSVATVENGVVTAVAKGSTSIVAEASDGSHVAMCEVIVGTAFGDNLIYAVITGSSTALTTLVIGGSGDMPANVGIENYPWYKDRGSIKNIRITEGVTSVGNFAFTGCKADYVTLPESLTKIGRRAFYDCQNHSLTIGKNLTEIGDDAFGSELGYVSVAEENSAFSSDQDGVLFNKDQTKLILYPSQNQNAVYYIPEGVTTIGSYAFKKCAYLCDVIAPQSLAVIESNAFTECTYHCDLFLPKGLTTVALGAFDLNTFSNVYYAGSEQEWTNITGYGNVKASTVHYNVPKFVPLHVINIEQQDPAQLSIELVQGDTIPLSVSFDPADASNKNIQWSSNCSYVAKVDANGNVKATGVGTATIKATSACAACSRNVYATINVSVKAPLAGSGKCGDNINWELTYEGKLTLTGSGEMSDYDYGNQAPWYGKTVTSVVMDSNITKIGKMAFYECTGLKSITIPQNVTVIGEEAFGGCSGLNSISVASGNAAFCVSGGILYNKAMTEIIKCPAGYSATSLTIGNTVTTIGLGAFEGCSSLQTVTIPANVTTISDFAFDNCTSIETVLIDENSKLKTIGDGAFYGNNISEIILPKSITSIGGKAFWTSKTSSLTIRYRGTEAEWNNITLGDPISYDPPIMEYNYGAYVPVSKITLTPSTAAGLLGVGESLTLSASVMPENATDKTIEWETSDKTVATVQDGVVTAVTNGTAVITAKSAKDGVSASYTVQVVSKCGDNAYWSFDGETLTIEGSGAIYDYSTLAENRPWKACDVQKLVIADGITRIGNGNFSSYSNLKYVTIPKSVKEIGNSAFSVCSSLKFVDLSGVETIGENAFYDCENLYRVNLGTALKSIGNYAFYRCYRFSSANYTGTEAEWSKVSFEPAYNTSFSVRCESVLMPIQVVGTVQGGKGELIVKPEIHGDSEGKVLVVAGYDYGKLVDLYIGEVGVADTITLSGDYFSEVKLTVWDSAENMKPLSQVSSISDQSFEEPTY